MPLPQAFIDSLTPHMPASEVERLLHALTAEPSPVSIRLNPAKCPGGVPPASLPVEGGVPWCREGYYLTSRPAFTLDPLLHAGVYYAQEASSMFVAHVLRSLVPDGPVAMLDLCAAPGGKSTAALSVLPEGSWLVSNEIDRRRARILAENITKWGHPRVTVTANAPHDFRRLVSAFDVILVDAPCSGEGMFRKDPAAVDEWSERKVAECAATQRSILADIWPTLRPGGLLIYSTCTYNVHEDEETLAYLVDDLGAEPVEIPVRDDWHIRTPLTGRYPCCRFMPHVTRGEGLFVSAVRKEGTTRSTAPQPDQRTLTRAGLFLLQHGVAAGITKGRDYIPSHAEALAVPTPSQYPQVELDLDTALRYLRRESIVLPEALPDGTSTPRGYVIVTHQGHPLGFVKHLGNRANNLYPQEWRIRYV